MAKADANVSNKVRFLWFGARGIGLLGSTYYVRAWTAAERARIAAMLEFDMIASPNFVRFVYDGDNTLGSETEIPTGSDQIEYLFLNYFAAEGPRRRADGVRRPLGLRAVHRGGHPGGRPVHGRRGAQDRGGRDLRRRSPGASTTRATTRVATR